MYQALYRKYRPKNFDEVVGQDVIVKTLKNAIIQNKISHAYIFTGPRGTGKTSMAKIFAKTVNCKNIENGIPCGKCACCLQFDNNQNIDILEIDAASNNGVDEIRELKNKVNLVPTICKYKVYIIDEVHMLSTSAFNALLKTLEEPPSHVIFILATTDPQKILPTIISRCQRFDFKKISENNIKKCLENVSKIEKINIDNDALDEIARIADGGMRDALSIFDQVIAFSSNNIDCNAVHEVNGTISQYNLKKFVQEIYNRNLKCVFSIIDEFDNLGKNFYKLLEEFIVFFKNVLLVKKVPDYFLDEKNNLYSDFSPLFSDEQIIKIIDVLNNSISSMKSSGNLKLLFELSMIKIFNLLSNLKDNEFDKNFNNSLNSKNINSVNSESLNSQISLSSVKSKEFKEKLNDLKELRINNTLARLDKKMITLFREKKQSLSSFLYDDKIGEYISMLLDSEIKAASDEYVIFVLKTENLVDMFNKKLNVIEKIFNDKLGVSYKLISVSVFEWDLIRKQFNNKEKKYNYIVENFDYDNLFENEISKNNDSTIDSLFKNIVEYK